MADVVAAWEALDAAWRECFQLAWDAYAAGTIAVGAVVVAADGAIVSRGRNRIYERDAPPRELAGSYLAHAEVNAVAQLDPGRRYRDHTLYSTLEPCLLCVGAIRLATVGRVEYAAADADGGAAHVRVANRMARRWMTEFRGPREDPFARLAALLPAEYFACRHRETTVADEMPHEARAAAVELGRRGTWEAARDGASLADILPSIADLLEVAPRAATEQAEPAA